MPERIHSCWPLVKLTALIAVALYLLLRHKSKCTHSDSLFPLPKNKCPVWLDSQFKRQAAAFQYPVQASRSHCEGWLEYRSQLADVFVRKYLHTLMHVVEQHMRADLGPSYDTFVESALQSKAE